MPPDPVVAAAPTRENRIAAARIRTTGNALYLLLAGEYGNLILAPYALGAALGVVSRAAGGVTREEFLGLVHDAGQLGPGWFRDLEGWLAQGFARDPHPWPTVVDPVVGLFGQAGSTWSPGIRQDLESTYGVGVDDLDLAGDPGEARDAINRWAVGRAGPDLPDVVERHDLSPDDRLLLVSTTRMAAWWPEPLRPDPAPMSFTLGDGEVVRVPSVSATVTARTRRGREWRSLSVPMRGGLVATLVLASSGFEYDIERTLVQAKLPSFVGEGPDVRVRLRLPAFTVRRRSSLRAPLEALGLRTLFTPDADLSRISTEEPVRLSAFLHDVVLSLDHHGVRAGGDPAPSTVPDPAPYPDPASDPGPAASHGAEEEMVLDRVFGLVVHDAELLTTMVTARIADPRG